MNFGEHEFYYEYQQFETIKEKIEKYMNEDHLYDNKNNSEIDVPNEYSIMIYDDFSEE